VHSKSARSISFASCVVAVVALTGCGSSHKSGVRPLSDCEARLENNAAAAVLRKAFNDGRAGSAQEIASKYFKGRSTTSYLDSSGKLLPYSKIKDLDTRYDFDAWMGHVEGTAGKVGDDMFAARMNVRHNSPCDSLTS
jgi:hypothetical protein